jgi:hypothetical protein
LPRPPSPSRLPAGRSRGRGLRRGARRSAARRSAGRRLVRFVAGFFRRRSGTSVLGHRLVAGSVAGLPSRGASAAGLKVVRSGAPTRPRFVEPSRFRIRRQGRAPSGPSLIPVRRALAGRSAAVPSALLRSVGASEPPEATPLPSIDLLSGVHSLEGLAAFDSGDGSHAVAPVPSSWFRTTSTVSSALPLVGLACAGGLTHGPESRACCIPLPILGFAAFRSWSGRRLLAVVDHVSPQRGSHPSEESPHHQPFRIPAAVAPSPWLPAELRLARPRGVAPLMSPSSTARLTARRKLSSLGFVSPPRCRRPAGSSARAVSRSRRRFESLASVRVGRWLTLR